LGVSSHKGKRDGDIGDIPDDRYLDVEDIQDSNCWYCAVSDFAFSFIIDIHDLGVGKYCFSIALFVHNRRGAT